MVTKMQEPGIGITKATHPALVNALEEIALADREPACGDDACISIPARYAHLANPAERSLSRLRAASEQEWRDFLHGDAMTAAAIREGRGDLDEAETLLWQFHTGWEDGIEPPAEPSHEHP